MKKHVIIGFAFAIALISQTSFAQLGVRVGMNFSNLSLNEEVVDAATNSKTGYHAGLTYNLGVGPVGLEVGALWTTLGSEIDLSSVEAAKAEVDLDYIQVPVALRFNFFPMLYAKAGGYIAGSISTASDIINLDQNNPEYSEITNILDNLNKFDAGLVFGLGVKLSKLEVEGGFDLGLVSLEDPEFSTEDLDLSNAVYKVGVTYRF